VCNEYNIIISNDSNDNNIIIINVYVMCNENDIIIVCDNDNVCVI